MEHHLFSRPCAMGYKTNVDMVPALREIILL